MKVNYISDTKDMKGYFISQDKVSDGVWAGLVNVDDAIRFVSEKVFVTDLGCPREDFSLLKAFRLRSVTYEPYAKAMQAVTELMLPSSEDGWRRNKGQRKITLPDPVQSKLITSAAVASHLIVDVANYMYGGQNLNSNQTYLIKDMLVEDTALRDLLVAFASDVSNYIPEDEKKLAA